jgi:hypothetical protein
MLCPVCKLVPLTGRKATAKTCSDKCRSAAYRERKQKRSDTPQQATRQTPARSAGRWLHARRSDAANWERIVSAAADRIIHAIELHGLHATSQRITQERIDMREQIVGQAPKEAAGYRLVLPPRRAGDAPKLSPSRKREREVPCYSLSPFEYPDDIRLCNGAWYRIVWIDAQDARIRLQPGEPVPGLYYFVGPPAKATSAPMPSMPASENLSGGPAPSQPLAMESVAPMAASETGSASQPASALPLPAVPVKTPEAASADTPAAAATTPQSQSDRALVPSPLRTTEISLPDGSLLTGISEDTEAAFKQLLATLPKIPLEHWGPIYGFVMQVPWMIWLLNEERRQQAAASGLPPPQGPALNLSAKDREVAARLAGTAPSYLVPFCKRLFLFLREHGTDVLQCAPVPFHPLPQREQQAVLHALRDPHQRTFMDYICRWQDALLNQGRVPEEPSVKLRSDRKNEIRKLMADLRAVVLFRQRLSPSSVA